MATTLIPVRSEADILPEWRDTPIGELLRIRNLGAPGPSAGAGPALLIAQCMEHPADLDLPAGFALSLHTGAASLKRVPFKVSWAIGIAGVRAIALIVHRDCGMVGLPGRREQFVARLIEVGGWERPAAEQQFDHWSDLFEVDDPVEFAAAEAARLRNRYPRLPVAPLLHDPAGGLLQQIR